MNKDYAHSMQDDIISRQDAMGTMLNLFHWCTMPTRKEIRKAIESLPSAEPKHGEWIDLLGKGNEWECSVCKCSIESHGSIAYKYCPNCGVRMIEEGKA